MYKIGMLTIGQSPREDIVGVMRRYLPQGVELLQRGALDGLDPVTVAGLEPQAEQSVLVTRMKDGAEVQVAREKILPLMQGGIDALAAAGAVLIVLLCTGDFPELCSKVMVLFPGTVLRSLIAALAKGMRLGVIVPSAAQFAWARERWAGLDVVTAAASPYLEPESIASEWKRAARELAGRSVDLVYLDCMGMGEGMKEIVRQEIGRPVILASSIVARIVNELIGD